MDNVDNILFVKLIAVLQEILNLNTNFHVKESTSQAT